MTSNALRMSQYFGDEDDMISTGFPDGREKRHHDPLAAATFVAVPFLVAAAADTGAAAGARAWALAHPSDDETDPGVQP